MYFFLGLGSVGTFHSACAKVASTSVGSCGSGSKQRLNVLPFTDGEKMMARIKMARRKTMYSTAIPGKIIDRRQERKKTLSTRAN